MKVASSLRGASVFLEQKNKNSFFFLCSPFPREETSPHTECLLVGNYLDCCRDKMDSDSELPSQKKPFLKDKSPKERHM